MEKKRQALKRLMEAVEKELLQKPNRKTLDRLSLLAGFQDWESFQETLHGELGGETIYGGHRGMRNEEGGKNGYKIEDARIEHPLFMSCRFCPLITQQHGHRYASP